MTSRWVQGRGRGACDPLTQDQRARTAAAQPGSHRRDQAPPGHACREQRAGRRPQLSGGPRLPLLPSSAWVLCPPLGSCSSRGARRVPEGWGRPARDARGRSGRLGRVTLGRAPSRGHCSIPCVAGCPVSRSSDLCLRVPVGGRRQLLASIRSAVGGREGIRGPCAGLCFYSGPLVALRKDPGEQPLRMLPALWVPALLPRQLTSSGSGYSRGSERR